MMKRSDAEVPQIDCPVSQSFVVAREDGPGMVSQTVIPMKEQRRANSSLAGVPSGTETVRVVSPETIQFVATSLSVTVWSPNVSPPTEDVALVPMCRSGPPSTLNLNPSGSSDSPLL